MLCTQCPRSCGALRTDTRGDGLCRMLPLPVLARAALHHWEEPPISGTRGSGTIFFSGCSLGCVFCQNEEISHRGFGKAVTLERLAGSAASWWTRGPTTSTSSTPPITPM